jgi:kynurenine formamidase
VDAAIRRLRDTLERMERALEQTEWVANDRFTLADLSLMPTIVRMEDLGLQGQWSDLPRVTDWFRRCRPARPSPSPTIPAPVTSAPAAEHRPSLPAGPFPMPRKFVDLSIFLENDVLSDPPAFAPKIQYFTHENTFEQIEPFFPGLKKEDLPDGEGWAVELVNLSTHNGTHLDAPYHFHSTMDNALGTKKPAIAIHDVPLEWCFQPGVKLDFRHFADGYVVTAADVEAELKRIGHTLKPLEIVAVNTRAGSRYGNPDYVSAGLRHGLRGHDVPAGARRAPDRHRCLELGRAVRAHGQEIR